MRASTRADLESELEQLELAKQGVEAQIAALRLLLHPSDQKPRVQRSKRRHAKRHVAKPWVAKNASMGLREALRQVLAHGPQFPGDVIAALQNARFEVSGKLSLATRVYNELGRLRR